jgi:Chaperone of endosialidase
MKTTRKLVPVALGLVVLGGFLFARPVQAVVPARDGGYPGGNTAEGQNALLSLTTGGYNTAVGYLSLKSDTTGGYNTAVGSGTLFANTAQGNTATGAFALLSNTSDDSNTANGAVALFSNTTGSKNTAMGANALKDNTTGFANTGNGVFALYQNTTGGHNTATGVAALEINTVGSFNTAIGDSALFGNTSGNSNTATGLNALLSNTTGDANVANGVNALSNNTFGSGNTALGFNAGNNVITANSVICIAHTGQNMSNSCYINYIFGATSSGGTAVYTNSNGKLGTTTSARRFKEDIKPMNNASEALFALRPITFHYKKEIDPARTAQFGLVAEEVEKVNRDLVVRDNEGKPYSVRYDQVNAMLLNEFLKEHNRDEEQQATIADLKSTVAQLQKAFESKLAKQEKQIETLSLELRKVSGAAECAKARSPGDRQILSDL